MSNGLVALLLLLFPAAGAVILAGRGWRSPRAVTVVVGPGVVWLSFLATVALFLGKANGDFTYWTWVKSGSFDVPFGLLIDNLSIFMCFVITGVGALIVTYSVGYMEHEDGPSYARFFTYMDIFVFSMLLLVLADNFIFLIVGWALVGLSSYLLIGFWYQRHSAVVAARKAFVMNVIGDVGMILGTFVLFVTYHQATFQGVFGRLNGCPRGVGQQCLLPFTSGDTFNLELVGFLFLVGAVAKSAQLPLHTWLPDAMEGPTPVSALIHAATMVTAGVYLIARLHPLFEQAPAAADVAAITGCATLVFAATVALVVTDLKRVIAYSTISQIGYMVMGVSTFAYTAGLFHLMTHAFFKALLFMGAGSVIGAMGGEQSLDKMGGFRRAMPFTFATFTIGALALSAFPLMSGLFSKDAILAFDLHRGGLYAVLAVIGYVAAGLTALYAFRMVFRVFLGDPVEQAASLEGGELWHGEHFNPATGEQEDTDAGFPGPEHHIAEREGAMRAAMAPLALLSVVGGIALIPGVTTWLERFLDPVFHDSRLATQVPSTGAEWAGLVVGSMLAVVGVGF